MQFMGLFQSTPPMREATQRARLQANRLAVSIHASHAGGDLDLPPFFVSVLSFNPRLPCGRRLVRNCRTICLCGVSIHASHAGGDSASPVRSAGRSSFNPRLPCGRRHGRVKRLHFSAQFQSTPPMREATLCLQI